MNQNQPPSSGVSLHDIISFRHGLQAMTEPSPEITASIAHLDKVIAAICMGFVIPTPMPLPKSSLITSFDPDQPSN